MVLLCALDLAFALSRTKVRSAPGSSRPDTSYLPASAGPFGGHRCGALRFSHVALCWRDVIRREVDERCGSGCRSNPSATWACRLDGPRQLHRAPKPEPEVRGPGNGLPGECLYGLL